jgi:flavodoxin
MNNNFIEEVEKEFDNLPHGSIGECGGDFIDFMDAKQFISQKLTQQREELKKEIVEIAEEHIEQERYSGTPHAINTLISKIKNI